MNQVFAISALIVASADDPVALPGRGRPHCFWTGWSEVNAIGSKTTVLLVLIGLLYGQVDMFVDIALAYAMLNFIAVLAAGRYFHKRRGLGEK